MCHLPDTICHFLTSPLPERVTIVLWPTIQDVIGPHLTEQTRSDMSATNWEHGFLITFAWLFHDFLMTFSWLSHDFLMTFSWFSHNFLRTLSWLSLDFLMNFLWIFMTSFDFLNWPWFVPFWPLFYSELLVWHEMKPSSISYCLGVIKDHWLN